MGKWENWKNREKNEKIKINGKLERILTHILYIKNDKNSAYAQEIDKYSNVECIISCENLPKIMIAEKEKWVNAIE